MGGSKTAIFTQVVHFYSDGVDHITIGGNTFRRYASKMCSKIDTAPTPI
jgi:hypothetical protein